MDFVLEVKEIYKSFKKVQAVSGLSFSVKRGEVFGLLGPNGAGKTTTLEICEGLQKPDKGEVKVLGASPEERKNREKTGIQLQSTALYERLKVKEILYLYQGYYTNGTEPEKLMQQVSLTEKKNALVKTLSGGQKQRLAMALAMINEPELIFLDEPTTGLDPQARRNIWEIILGMKSAGKTVVLTTHYMEEAELLCDRVAIMDNGKIKALGAPSELLSHLPVKAYVGFPKGTDPDWISGLPEVKEIVQFEEKHIAGTNNLNSTLKALIEKDSLQSLPFTLDELSIRKASLEDVFIHITGKSLRD
jgi:ABC-2 type transport system ATP-binding protein